MIPHTRHSSRSIFARFNRSALTAPALRQRVSLGHQGPGKSDLVRQSSRSANMLALAGKVPPASNPTSHPQSSRPARPGLVTMGARTSRRLPALPAHHSGWFMDGSHVAGSLAVHAGAAPSNPAREADSGQRRALLWAIDTSHIHSHNLG